MAKNQTKRGPRKFVFKKYANIGAADAIEDKKFLEKSFLDKGELDILSDTSEPMCIILGRTGSGKTALLEQLCRTKERVIKLSPEDLALIYVSNNEVLNFFKEAGVEMDLFYRLLWRHIFAVEIIREHYHIVNEETQNSFLDQIKSILHKDKTKEQAMNYFLDWEGSFWLDSEHRVKEITQKLEKDLGASLGGKLKGDIMGSVGAEVNFNSETAKILSKEQKSEVVHRGQKVVNDVQMRELSKIIELLEYDFLDDRQKKYYVAIDRLDENWVNDDLRYRLIRALLDTIREFNHKIQNVKIIVAIREDLLARVFRYTRDPGYQEEKYKSLYLPITWKESELEDLLDRRVKQLIREQYTTQIVALRDLLPSVVNKKDDPIRYLLVRIMLNPRDAILFFNECIRAAEGKAKITQTALKTAEEVYSLDRLRALADEWSSDYLNLIELSFFLKKAPKHFRLADIKNQVEDHMLKFLFSNSKEDYIYRLIEDKFNTDDLDGFMQEMTKILFRVGIIGVKEETYTTPRWSYQGRKLTSSEINLNVILYIHPAFWRVLGVSP